jgi:hypothetical protein
VCCPKPFSFETLQAGMSAGDKCMSYEFSCEFKEKLEEADVAA